jgi:hypothetical protein
MMLRRIFICVGPRDALLPKLLSGEVRVPSIKNERKTKYA